MKDEFIIKVNGKISGTVYNKRCLLSALFFLFFDRLEIMSDDAIVKNVENSFSLVQEMNVGSIILRKIEHGRKLLRFYSRDKLIKYIFDVILAEEGFGTLPGFGMAKVEKSESGGKMIKRRFLFNPEKQSIYSGI